MEGHGSLGNQAAGIAVRRAYEDLARLTCMLADTRGAAIVRLEPELQVMGRCGEPIEDLAGDVTAALSGECRSNVNLFRDSVGEAIGAIVVTDRGGSADLALGSVVAPLGTQAAALMALERLDGERRTGERHRRFIERLSDNLRALVRPDQLASTAVSELRREFGATSVTFGTLREDGAVSIVASDDIDGESGAKKMPLAAFGIGAGARAETAPVRFPTEASVTVPIVDGGRLDAIMHLRSAEGGSWSARDLDAFVESARLVWTERKRALRDGQLRDGERRLQSVLESMSDGFFALDRDWRFVTFNRAAERFFGRARQQVLELTLFEAFPDCAMSPLVDHLACVMATGTPGAIEMRSVARPDRTVEIRASAQPGGGVAVSFSDVTDRIAAEAARRATADRLAALVGQARAGIAETALDGTFLSANSRFCEIVGRSEADLLQLDQASITHPLDVAASLRMCGQMLSTGAPFEIAKRYVRPEGVAVPTTSAVGLVRSDGRTTALAIVIDRNERRIAS